MSSSNSPTLMLELGAQRQLIPALLLATVSALVAGLMLLGRLQGGAGGALLMAALGATASGVTLWRQGYWHDSRRVSRLTWLQSGAWQMTLADGQVIETALSPQSWITGWIWCLRFRTSAAPPVLVWRTQLPPVVWQQWRMRLELERRRSP